MSPTPDDPEVTVLHARTTGVFVNPAPKTFAWNWREFYWQEVWGRPFPCPQSEPLAWHRDGEHVPVRRILARRTQHRFISLLTRNLVNSVFQSINNPCSGLIPDTPIPKQWTSRKAPYTRNYSVKGEHKHRRMRFYEIIKWDYYRLPETGGINSTWTLNSLALDPCKLVIQPR